MTARGWCPGALRPMASGDGFVVRLRVSGGELSLGLAGDLAVWSQRFGNGALDLSARGGLQLRGLREATLPSLTDRLAEAGLLDATPEAEAVRNVLVSPFAGLDPAAPFDVAPDARALERELQQNDELWALPGKFGFAFDAGALPLGETGADVTFVAAGPDAYVVGLGERVQLGPIARGEAVAAAVKLARVFLALRRGPSPPRRLRDALDGAGAASFAEALGLPAAPWRPAPARAAVDRLGVQRLGEGAFVGFAAPFGRLHAADLGALAALAADHGATSLRLTPWRALIVAGLTHAEAKALAQAARGLRLILCSADARLAVCACPGAPDCASALGETRELARSLAALAPAGLHVSGCAKGCAHPGPAPFTIVAAERGYDLVLDGRADATPIARGLSLEALAARLSSRSAA